MTTRIAILGGPKSGKTFLAAQIAGTSFPFVRSTDDLISKFGWSELSLEVSRWFDEPGPWIIEGVAVARGLRKWLGRVIDGESLGEIRKPADRIIVLSGARVELAGSQISMMKGCEVAWAEVQGELEQRGVEIERVRVG